MRRVSAATTVAFSLRIHMHVYMHIFNFYSGLSLRQYLTLGCNSILLFGNWMPLDWLTSEPLMLVPQRSVSRVRSQSSTCQIPNLKSHFLSVSKQLSLLPITVKHSALGQMLLNWYFPGGEHTGRSRTLREQRGQSLPFGALGPLHEACSDISYNVLLRCCSGLRTLYLLQAFHSFGLGVYSVIEKDWGWYVNFHTTRI